MEHSNKSTTMATSTLTSPAMSPLPSPLLLPQSPRGAPLANSSQQQIFNINNSSSNNKHAQQVNGGFSFYQSPQSHQFSHSSNMFGHSTHAYPSSTRPFADDSSNINSSTINQNNEHHNGSPGKLLPSTSNISLLSLSFAGASLSDHEATMDPLREEESKDNTNTSPLSPKQNQQQQQQVPSQWFKSSNSLSSSFNSPGPYVSTAHQRRVSHYRNSMSSTNLMGQASPSLSRHGSSNWGHISGLGNNSSNSANSGNFNSNVLGGVSVGSQAIPQASKPRRPSSSSYMPTSIAGSSGMQSPMYPSSVSSSSNLQMHDEPYLAPISLANSPSTFFLAQTPPIVLSNFNSYTRSPIEPNNYIHGSNSPLGNSNAQNETTSVLNFEPEKKAHLSVFSLMGGEDNNKYVPKKNTEGEEEKVKRSNISKNIEKERAAALAASRVGDNNSNTATNLTNNKPDTAKKSGVGNDTTPKTIPEVAPVAAITPSNVMNLNANKKNLASSSIFSTLAKANDNVINTTTSKKPTSIVNLSRDPPPLRSLQDNNNNNNNNNNDRNSTTIETSLEKSTNTQDFLNNFNKMDNKNFNRDSTQSTSNIEDRQKREQLKVSKTAAAITAALETEIFKNKDKQGTKYDIVKEDIPQHLMGKVLGSGSYPINIPTNNQKLDSNNSTKTTANEDSSDCKNRTDTLDDNSTKISINNCNDNNENNNNKNNDDDNSSSRNNNIQNSTQQPSTPPSSSSHYLKGSRMTPIQSSLSASISNLRGLASPNATTMSNNSSSNNNNNSGSLASSSAAAQAARRRKSSLSLVHQGLVVTTSSTNSIPITTGTSGSSSSNMSPYSEGYTYRRPPSSSNLSQLQEGIPMPGSSAGSSTSLSSINRMVPDSPDLQPLSMTPLESGLMTPMALDMSMSRVGSYASVDNFFVNPQQVQQPVRVLEVLKQEKEEEDDEDKKKDQQEGEENEDNGSSSTTTIN